MNSTLTTTAAMGGTGYALVTILVWLLGLAHVSVPATVANALIVLFAWGTHKISAIVAARTAAKT